MTADSSPDGLLVGRIAGPYGVRGWVRVASFTDPVDNLLDYRPWLLSRAGRIREVVPHEGRVHGKGLVVCFDGIDDRDSAAELRGSQVWVDREQLPPPGEGSYYWADLVGLEVSNTDGVALGRVVRLMETGANDVLVIQGDRERLVPFVQGQVVRSVNLDDRTMVVAWDADF